MLLFGDDGHASVCKPHGRIFISRLVFNSTVLFYKLLFVFLSIMGCGGLGAFELREVV
jgi:hypothetical protein